MLRGCNMTGWAAKDILRVDRTVLCAEYCRVRAAVGGAAEGPRRVDQSDDADAQPAVRQGAGDPRRQRGVEADDRCPAGETRGADRLTFDSDISQALLLQ